MEGKPLRMVVFQAPPWLFTYEENNITIAGGSLGAQVYFLAASIKYGLEIIVSDFNDFGTEIEPGNWTGPSGIISRGEADSCGGFHVQSIEKFSYFGFSNSLMEATCKILSGPAKKFSKVTGSLLSSVTRDVWIALVVSWMALSVVSYVMEKIERNVFLFDIPKESLIKTAFAFYGLLFERGFDYLPSTTYRRLVLAVWLILCEVLMSGIGGSLSSKMAVSDVPERIDTVQDILDRPDICPIIPRGIQIEHILQTSPDEHHKRLWKRIQDCKGIYGLLETATPENMDRVHEGSAVIVAAAEFILAEFASAGCRRQVRPLYVGKESLRVTHYVMVHRKDMDAETIEMFSQGALRYAESGEATQASSQNSKDARPCYAEAFLPTPVSAISLQDMVKVFQIWMAGIAIATFVFPVEILVKYFARCG